MKKLIHIKRKEDNHDCETCGSSWSQGAEVSIDGHIVMDFEPIAACWDGTTYSDEFILGQILDHLGYTVVYHE